MSPASYSTRVTKDEEEIRNSSYYTGSIAGSIKSKELTQHLNVYENFVGKTVGFLESCEERSEDTRGGPWSLES